MKRKQESNFRRSLLILSLVMIFIGTACLTIAFITLKTDPVINTFAPATVSNPEIPETFDYVEKKDVKVTVTGDEGVDCYVRAMIVITLQDDDQNTIAKTPVEGTDYTIDLGSDWQYIAPYYYYKGVVPTGQDTTNLINSCTSLNSDYHLVVDILSQTIQADGVITEGDSAGVVNTPAVEHAWGVSYSNGTWSVASGN